MESATITKVTLRKEKLRSGKLSLYLDYYPPIWNPHIKKMSRREFLGLYLIGNPKDRFELDYNEEIMLKPGVSELPVNLQSSTRNSDFLTGPRSRRTFLNISRVRQKRNIRNGKSCISISRISVMADV